MGKIWMPGGGGGGASSDDCTLTRAAVPAGMKAVTADSDDEAMEGTLNPDTTLADSQALSGQTFLKWNPQTKLFEKHTGGMANKGAWTGSVAMNGSITIPAGFHNGSGNVNGPVITNRGNYGGTGNSRGNDTSGKRMWVKVPGGYYNENAQVFLNWSDICSMAGLTADKIKKNVSIMGITGSWEGYVKSPLYLYNKGTWSGLQTTGMTAVNLGAGVYLQEKDGSIGFASRNRPDSPSSNARLNQTFNLSSYKYIKVNASSGYDNYALIGVSTSGNAGIGQYVASAKSTTGSGYIILDVSSLSGNYYIYFEGSSLNGYTQTHLVVSFNELIVTNN